MTISGFSQTDCNGIGYFISYDSPDCSTDGQLCLSVDWRSFNPSYADCADNYKFQIVYPTGSYIYTDLGDFALHSLDQSFTRLRTDIIVANSHGFLRYCLTLVEQQPNVDLIIQVVNANNDNDVLSSEVYDPDEVVTIGQTGVTTTLSQAIADGDLLTPGLALGRGQRIQIAGTLLVDQNYTFGVSSFGTPGATLNDIVMLPGARIETELNNSVALQFFRAKIHGCGDNWDQILINEGNSTVEFAFSTVEDANIGVNLQDRANLVLLGTRFENCTTGFGALGTTLKDIDITTLSVYDAPVSWVANCGTGARFEHVQSGYLISHLIMDECQNGLS
ncbi:MAG: hypothetical protein D6772_05030, partial [Bacteroidetes bacterium]